jgi:hypothetical protein
MTLSGSVAPDASLGSARRLVDTIDRHVDVLRTHLPYHESDHVLGIAYHVLRRGTCLQDIELRRQNEVSLDAFGGAAHPGPDNCERLLPAR